MEAAESKYEFGFYQHNVFPRILSVLYWKTSKTASVMDNNDIKPYFLDTEYLQYYKS